MKRPIPILAALLAVQLLVAGGLALAGVQRRGGDPKAPLVSFDAKAADRITVEGPAGARAELVKADGAWKIASRGGFPADAGKVQRLLDRLAAIRRATPIATSAEAVKRFKVADDDFERRVVVEAQGKPIASALFGSVASMRMVHARAAGSSEVQTAEFSLWESPVQPDEWIDRTVLKIPKEEIEAVIVGEVTIERAGPARDAAQPESGGDAAAAPTWRASGLPKGAELDQAAAEALVDALSELSISGVAEAQAASSQDALAVSVRRKGGAVVEHRFARPAAAGGDWTLRTSLRPEAMKVASYTVEALQRTSDPGTLSGKPPQAQGLSSPAKTVHGAPPAPAVHHR